LGSTHTNDHAATPTTEDHEHGGSNSRPTPWPEAGRICCARTEAWLNQDHQFGQVESCCRSRPPGVMRYRWFI